jgi:hypothetical protein
VAERTQNTLSSDFQGSEEERIFQEQVMGMMFLYDLESIYRYNAMK